MGDLVTINSAMLGVFAFTVGCLTSGMFFAGIDATPPDKIAITNIIIQKWVGIALIISAIPLLLSAPYGLRGVPGVAFWFGTLLAYFGILWIWLSETLRQGGDLKPIGIMLLFTSVVSFTYVVIAAKTTGKLGIDLFGKGYTGQMFGDVFILMIMAGTATLSAFIGIRFKPAFLKYVGWMFIALGVWGTYMSVRYIYELSMATLLAPA